MNAKPAMLTARDAGQYLGVGITEIRRLIKAGELEVRYIGARNSREYRVLTESCDAYIAALPSEPRSA